MQDLADVRSLTDFPPVDFSPLDRHQKIVLQIGGGKDSTAVLYLLRPFWDRIRVLWANTGASLPELEAHMAELGAMLPHFEIVQGRQPEHIAQAGWPSQTLPMAATSEGRLIESDGRQLLQPYTQCCFHSWWMPMQRRTEELGATLIIRGQRTEERRKAPIRSGHIQPRMLIPGDPVEIWFPIQEWTSAQVWRYLWSVNAKVSPVYRDAKHSIDCWNCTAFPDEMRGRFAYLRENHPEKADELVRRITIIRNMVAGDVAELNAVLRDQALDTVGKALREKRIADAIAGTKPLDPTMLAPVQG